MKFLNNIRIMRHGGAVDTKKATADAFKATNPWKKPNTLLPKGEYAIAKTDKLDEFFIVSRTGTKPWLLIDTKTEVAAIAVLPIKDIPEDLWSDDKQSKAIQHPKTGKWLKIEYIN